MNEYKVGDGSGSLSIEGCNKCPGKLNTYDYLADISDNSRASEIVEVEFKSPRKGYFINSNHLSLAKGDIVAVEASPGHDVGTVTMTGRLVQLQMKKANLRPDVELKRIYRKARQIDLDKWEEARKLEHSTMIESRQIAKGLGLQMKIGDVEYQGDGGKAIFYYIADGRVDFRQLIKDLAARFRVRIEMKQIGARQEAGRIGGMGPCGRELCCATWLTRFVSVSTNAARFQDMSLNPQKLAGQCAKLKCCMNYEVDQYVEKLKQLPSREIVLYSRDSNYYFFKADVLAKLITYSTDKHLLVNAVTISAERAFEIIALNQQGKKPEKLTSESEVVVDNTPLDLVEQENISRFDKAKKKKKKKGQQQGQSQQTQADSQLREQVQPQEPMPRQDEAARTNQSQGESPNRNESRRGGQRRNDHGNRRHKNPLPPKDNSRNDGSEHNPNDVPQKPETPQIQ